MRNSFLFLLVALTGMSCRNNQVYSETRTVQADGWNRSQVMEFQFQPADTLHPHSVYFLLRNDNAYPYSNLFLIAELPAPDGTAQRDTLEYEMADATGRWLGAGSGSVVTHKLGYRKDVVFSENGVYTIRVSQAMRQNGSVEGLEILPGVLDLGLQLELNQE